MSDGVRDGPAQLHSPQRPVSVVGKEHLQINKTVHRKRANDRRLQLTGKNLNI